MVNTSNNSSHCGQGSLQSYLDNELSPQRERAVELHLNECDQCQSDLDDLRAMDQVIRKEIGFLRDCTPPPMDFESILRRVDAAEREEERAKQTQAQESKAEETKGWLQLLTDFLFGPGSPRLVLASMAVGAIVLFSLPKSNNPQSQDDIVFKGWRAEMLYARYNQKAQGSYSPTQTLQQSASLSARDLIQFKYQVPKAAHMMIVGLNDKGEVFPLVVSKDKHSQKVKAGSGRFPREQAFQLDHYIGLERYFLVVANKRFSFQKLQSMIRKTWKENKSDTERLNQLSQSWQIRTWVVRKTKR